MSFEDHEVTADSPKRANENVDATDVVDLAYNEAVASITVISEEVMDSTEGLPALARKKVLADSALDIAIKRLEARRMNLSEEQVIAVTQLMYELAGLPDTELADSKDGINKNTDAVSERPENDYFNAAGQLTDAGIRSLRLMNRQANISSPSLAKSMAQMERRKLGLTDDLTVQITEQMLKDILS